MCFVDRYSFDDCVEYPEVMHAHISAMIKKGDSQGRPILAPGEVVPQGRVYILNVNRMSRPRATKTHCDMTFLRAYPVNEAINRMKDAKEAGLYPCKVKAAESPTGLDWDNYVQCNYEFATNYCQIEGLARKSLMAREVLLYTFYGSFLQRGKEVPLIRCLHYKTMSGRHRFGKFVKVHFAKFLKRYHQNSATWAAFLTDCGSGEAPTEYCLLIEEGLRSFGTDIYAMGSKALNSKAEWAIVAVWRKREAYIALVRHIRGHTGYPQYDCYVWADYIERQHAGRTFRLRHLPLSDGRDFEGQLPPPWSGEDVKDSPRKRKKSVKRAPASVSAKVVVSKKTKRDEKPRVWDVEKDCFVSFE